MAHFRQQVGRRRTGSARLSGGRQANGLVFESLEGRRLLTADASCFAFEQQEVAAELAAELAEHHDHDHDGHAAHDHAAHEHDDHDLEPGDHADHDHHGERIQHASGGVYQLDPPPELHADDMFDLRGAGSLVGQGDATGAEPHEGSDAAAAATVVDEVPIYHSNPDAEQKIYLDFDGQTIRNSGWNADNNGRPIKALPFDNDGDPETFSRSEQRTIERVWARVSEAFSVFDLDVTTEEPSRADLRAGRKALRVMISTDVDQRTGNQWITGAGGVAFIGSWRWAKDEPVWVFENHLGGGDKLIAETAAHEIGHAFGLSHDGIQGGEEYYGGHGSGRTGWAPIMGTTNRRQLAQWSRGEYEDASNRENDLSVIASSINKVRYHRDDHSSTFKSATELTPVDGTIELEGLIHRSSDRDTFRFESGSGTLKIDVDPVRYGAMLDVQATLYDADGNEIEQNDRTNRLDARIVTDVPAGVYYLKVDGVGQGDASNGYSDYSSIGRYTVEIDVPAPVLPGDLDGDGSVAFADFLILSQNYGKPVDGREQGDLDDDGRVQFSDFLLLNQQYGQNVS